MKVMIVVTHLLGTGHLSRALTLARAFRKAGSDATVVSGGMPAPQLPHDDVSFVQLPALRSDGVNFSRLLDADAHLASDALLATREAQLISLLDHDQPDVLITELFPFGRRSLTAEFTALLRAAQSMKNRPLICASIRDILAPPSKPQKAVFAEQMIADFYDAVMVHSSAKITPLDLSWPVTDSLRQKLHYTGFVAPPAAQPHPDAVGKDEIIVSAGGGDVGTNLFDCAIAAAKMDKTRKWRLLIGGQNGAARSDQINEIGLGNIMAEPARPDFRQMLHHAHASVSMCGYNTALDVLQTSCPAVFLPFDAGGEVEQGIRAHALAKQTGIAVLETANLTPATLLAALNTVTAAPPRPQLRTDLDGGAELVRIVQTMLNQTL